MATLAVYTDIPVAPGSVDDQDVFISRTSLGEPWSIIADSIVPVGCVDADICNPPAIDEVIFVHVAPPAICRGLEVESSYPYAVASFSVPNIWPGIGSLNSAELLAVADRVYIASVT